MSRVCLTNGWPHVLQGCVGTASFMKKIVSVLFGQQEKPGDEKPGDRRDVYLVFSARKPGNVPSSNHYWHETVNRFTDAPGHPKPLPG